MTHLLIVSPQFLVADAGLALLIGVHHEVPALLDLLLQRLVRWRIDKPWLCSITVVCEASQQEQHLLKSCWCLDCLQPGTVNKAPPAAKLCRMACCMNGLYTEIRIMSRRLQSRA